MRAVTVVIPARNAAVLVEGCLRAIVPQAEALGGRVVVVGNRVSVVLNGQKLHDNAVIEGITGGALDANETEAGPVMLQGDHGKVSFRRVVVTPITKAGS